MRILVSGAGGFVGRHLALAFAHMGHEVAALVRGAPPAGLERNKAIRIARADLAAAAEPLPTGPFDALFHCAAAIPAAVSDEAELTLINVEGSRRLFRHALDSETSIIVFCSSMAVYGRVTADIVGPATTIDEPNAYGRSKLATERLLAELSLTHAGLRAVSIRLPGIVGPGSHDNFLSDTIKRLAAGETVAVRNPDALFNNVVHVDDLAAFAAGLLDTLPPGHRVLTVAATDPLTIRDVVAILSASAGGAGGVAYRFEGRSFLVSTVEALSLGYRPASVRDAVERFAFRYAADRERTALSPRS